jgi:hypothetical protein
MDRGSAQAPPSVSKSARIATTIHPLQLLDGDLPATDHVFEVDLIVTPTKRSPVACPASEVASAGTSFRRTRCGRFPFSRRSTAHAQSAGPCRSLQARPAGPRRDRSLGRWTADASSDACVLVLAERERVRVGAVLEEGDVQRPLVHGVVRAHQLVQATVPKQAVPALVDVKAV